MSALSQSMKDNSIAPGWPEVLTSATNYGNRLSGSELDKIAHAADNIIDSVLAGLSAIGDIQWRAAANKDWGVDNQTVHSLGALQMTLADLVTELRVIEANATEGMHRLELVGTKETTP